MSGLSARSWPDETPEIISTYRLFSGLILQKMAARNSRFVIVDCERSKASSNARDGLRQMIGQMPATNTMTSSQMEVFSCELNRDGLPDFIINIWSGGAGLAAEGSEVTLLLSSRQGYRADSFYMYHFGKDDLVQFKAGGPVYLILNDLVSSDGEITRDGRSHNFCVSTSSCASMGLRLPLQTRTNRDSRSGSGTRKRRTTQKRPSCQPNRRLDCCRRGESQSRIPCRTAPSMALR
jgi:hypothetical protein